MDGRGRRCSGATGAAEVDADTAVREVAAGEPREENEEDKDDDVDEDADFFCLSMYSVHFLSDIYLAPQATQWSRPETLSSIKGVWHFGTEQ